MKINKNPESENALALVGIGCHFSGGADGPQAFWDGLCAGMDAIGEIPPDRWSRDAFCEKAGDETGRMRVRGGGFLADVSGFDAAFFGISPREAAVMDPQQRLLLETAWEALENAGCVPSAYAGQAVAVYMGGFAMDYKLLQLGASERELIGPHTSTGVAATLLANRISYWFDFRGASVTLDTACSSSLTAFHLACQDVRSGRCSMALAGGVNVMVNPEWMLAADKGGFLSADGRSKTFSAAADGYGRGEGAGVVVLKTLKQARQDGDRIYALVRGTAVNQDGHTVGITVPRASAQMAVMRAACADGGVKPSQVQVVEAHGTGTPVGDPIEVEAIRTVYGGAGCWIGSVKRSIGHLEAAAGVAGLIKTALCLYHGCIPPGRAIETLNPALDFSGLRLAEQGEAVPLQPNGCAGVNSFGFGGTNAHAVLQAVASESVERTDPMREAVLLPVSAKTVSALNAQVQAWRDVLMTPDVPMLDVLYTASVRREHHACRAAFVAKTRTELLDQLEAYRPVAGIESTTATGGVVIIFSGMGTQWAGMQRELLKTSTAFARVARRFDDAFRARSGWSLLEVLQGDQASERIHKTEVAQPAIVMMQAALYEMWRELGVKPVAIVGHSLGELTAAYAAGALSLEQLALLVYERSRLQGRLAGRGGMLAAALAVEVAERLPAVQSGVLSVAAINSPQSLTLAGGKVELEQVAAVLQESQVFHRFLQVDVPYHSAVMGEIQEEFELAVADCVGTKTVVPLYSSVLGGRIQGEDVGPAYWYRNLREPVQFAMVISVLQSEGMGPFLEVSPHPVLLHSVQACFADRNDTAVVLPTMKRDEAPMQGLLHSLARLYERGMKVNWRVLNGAGRLVDGAGYAWQHQPCWLESELSRARRLGSGEKRAGVRVARVEHALLGGRMDVAERMWSAVPDAQSLSALSDHIIQGQVVFPAAGYLDMAMAAAAQESDEGCTLSNVRFQSALRLSEKRALMLQLVWEADGIVHIYSRENEGESWRKHVTGELYVQGAGGDGNETRLERAKTECTEDRSVGLLYQLLRLAGYEYGPSFQCIRQLRTGAVGQVVAELDDVEAQSGSVMPPALLDAALQVLLAGALFEAGERLGPDVYLPVQIERVRLYRPARGKLTAHAVLEDADELQLTGRVTLYDDTGRLVLALLGVACRAVRRLFATQTADLLSHLSPVEVPAQTKSPTVPDGLRLLLLGTEKIKRAIGDLLAPSGGCIVQESEKIQGVLICSALERQMDWDEPFDDELLASILHLIQAVLKRNLIPEYGVLVALPIDALEQAALTGMLRVINNEHPELGLRIRHVDARPSQEQSERLLRELLRRKDVFEVCLQDDKRYELRLMPLPTAGAAVALQSNVKSDSWCLAVDPPGGGAVQQPVVLPCARQKPKADEIEVRVLAAGINFKDVLKMRGIAPAPGSQSNYHGPWLGLECAGVVTAVGDDVSAFSCGDAVMGFARAAMGRYAVTQAVLMVKKPETWSFEAAAGVPLAGLTAWYSLRHIARLQPGETVLIHSASGGVGQAAVELALRMGARVIATAGSEEKRAHLRAQGIRDVFDSRRSDYADAVVVPTGGRGVDVVLNTVTGELLRAGMHVLAPFGRFVELGKKDVDGSLMLSLAGFKQNQSFAAVDIDHLLAVQPARGGCLFREMMDAYPNAEPEVMVYPVQQAADAFEHMLKQSHLGKMVLRMDENAPLQVTRQVDRLSANGTYLITGGTSDMGLALAWNLVRHGARHLVLLSRSGRVQGEGSELLATIRELGVEVQVCAVDVADADALKTVLAEIRAGACPLKGVLHLANVYDDGYVEQMTPERMQRVLAPKARGAWNLHQSTRADDLDIFVLFSSVSSIIGNAGQSNYAAANAFLDALAVHRRQVGLPVLTLNLGALSGVGHVDADQALEHHLDGMGVQLISMAVLQQLLWQLLQQGQSAAVAAKMNWQLLQEKSAPNDRARYAQLVDDEILGASAKVEEVTIWNTALSPAALKQQLQERIRAVLASVLGFSAPQDLSATIGFFDAGLDSMLSLDFCNELEKAVGCAIAPTVPFRFPTIEKLAEHLMKEHRPESVDRPSEPQPDESADDVRSSLEQMLADMDREHE